MLGFGFSFEDEYQMFCQRYGAWCFFLCNCTSWKRHRKIFLKGEAYLYLLWSSKFGISNAISCTGQGGEQIWQKKNRLSLPSLQWTTQSPIACQYVQGQGKEKIRIFSLKRLQRTPGFVSCFISWSRRSRSFPSKSCTYHIISNQMKEREMSWLYNLQDPLDRGDEV